MPKKTVIEVVCRPLALVLTGVVFPGAIQQTRPEEFEANGMSTNEVQLECMQRIPGVVDLRHIPHFTKAVRTPFAFLARPLFNLCEDLQSRELFRPALEMLRTNPHRLYRFDQACPTGGWRQQ